MLIITLALGGLFLGLTAALYFKRGGRRSQKERRAKALSKMLAGEVAVGGGAVGSSGDSDGDD
jgi:hypothetical protein